jgi:hypothetical protein
MDWNNSSHVLQVLVVIAVVLVFLHGFNSGEQAVTANRWLCRRQLLRRLWVLCSWSDRRLGSKDSRRCLGFAHIAQRAGVYPLKERFS